jgi:hypothetical protein
MPFAGYYRRSREDIRWIEQTSASFGCRDLAMPVANQPCLVRGGHPNFAVERACLAGRDRHRAIPDGQSPMGNHPQSR